MTSGPNFHNMLFQFNFFNEAVSFIVYRLMVKRKYRKKSVITIYLNYVLTGIGPGRLVQRYSVYYKKKCERKARLYLEGKPHFKQSEGIIPTTKILC